MSVPGGREMDAKDKITIGIFSATAGMTIIGWAWTYYTTRQTQLRKDRLEHINRQLSEFYGPLLISCVAGSRAYATLLDRLKAYGVKDEIFKEGATLPEEPVLTEWVFWMKNVFMPLNDLREKLILEKLHLMREEDRAEMMRVLEDLVAHVSWCRAIVAKWDAKNYSEHYARIAFPALLQEYASTAFNQLKQDQEALLRELWPSNKPTNWFRVSAALRSIVRS